jgi:putative hydrolase of the HAD superfamily
MSRDEPIHAVAFDIDGTLYPNIRMYIASLPVVLRHVKLFRAYGDARKQIRRERPVTDIYERTAQLTAERLNQDPTEIAKKIDHVIYDKWESTLTNVRLYPGARELVEHLRGRGIRTAALSDFPVERKLRLLNLDGLWDVAFSAEETGYLKPNPEPFNRLIKELALPPEQILYVGNSYRYDVAGARACGLLTAHITHRKPADDPADFTFRRFSQLRDWLERRLVATDKP